MAKLTKAQRSEAAIKGAKTKAYRASLTNALNIKHMLDSGLSVGHVALLTDQSIKDVLDGLKLLTLVPNPYAQQIGVAAHGISLGQDLINSLNLTKKGGGKVPDVLKVEPQMTTQNQFLSLLRPFAHEVLRHPENVRGDIINTLNGVGEAITAPVTSAEDFFRKLTTGQP